MGLPACDWASSGEASQKMSECCGGVGGQWVNAVVGQAMSVDYYGNGEECKGKVRSMSAFRPQVGNGLVLWRSGKQWVDAGRVMSMDR